MLLPRSHLSEIPLQIKGVAGPLRWEDSMGAAPEPHQMHIVLCSRTKDVRSLRGKAEDEFAKLALRALPLAARSRIRIQRIRELLLDASEEPAPGRERIRLRTQHAKPLPVDLNPYIRLWAHFIALGVCYLLSGSSSRSVLFPKSKLLAPAPFNTPTFFFSRLTRLHSSITHFS